MKLDRASVIELFIRLGELLERFGESDDSRSVIERACDENSWFSPAQIASSVEAIRSKMLSHKLLTEWTSGYPTPSRSLSVGVIMAGNIPLVGFFDLLCVLVSGHKCLYKPSSKDSVLMEYVVSLVSKIEPNIALERYTEQPLDAIIATGSDNTNRYFRSRWGSLPSVLRANRSSVAIITAEQSEKELRGLALDIFSHSGLGCRNVSHLLIAEEYDMGRLVGILSEYQPINPKYLNNFRQRSALLQLSNHHFYSGSHFLLRESSEIPEALSEITFTKYQSINDITLWLDANRDSLQCVVCAESMATIIDHVLGMNSPSIRFGESQQPTLTDYPDGVDLLHFLTSL